jgi:hypothetical protein
LTWEKTQNRFFSTLAALVSMTTMLAMQAKYIYAQMPEDVKLPMVIYDVDFNDMPVDKPPQPTRKEEIEAAGKDPWKAVPRHTYSNIDFLTRDRTAIVKESAIGLEDKPVLFDCPDNRQPHWGPRMFLGIPHEIATSGKRFRVSLDVSMGSVTKMGGVGLGSHVGEVTFFEDGTVRLGSTEIARYQPAKPMHLEFLVDVPNRRVTVQVDDNEKVTVPWRQPEARGVFHGLRLDGLLPGGHARAPGQLAFDNINITLEN